MAVRQRLPDLIRSLKRELNPRPSNQFLPSLRRAFSLYDQINLIDNVPEDQLRFQQYTETGFKVNGVMYEGSLLCVGNLLMSWSPQKFSDVTPDSLSIFQTVRPIPEILILGCGRHIQPVDPNLRLFIRSTGMKLEALDSDILMEVDQRFLRLMKLHSTESMTRNASSTYNILNEEGRIVAAALLPYGTTS